MKRGRALVGHFKSSSQASEALEAVQTRVTKNKAKKVIHDCVTRWWSTWKFARRLRELKAYFGILVLEGVIDEEMNLTDMEWSMLEDIEELLEPFMHIQQLLEGQKYVTVSFVPFLLSVARHGLVLKSENARSEVVKNLARDMLTHKVKGFNTYWGTGDKDTLFDENEVAGRGNRQKGFPKTMLLAAALDPRCKSLKYLGPEDKRKVWDQVKSLMHSVIDEMKKKQEEVIDLVDIAKSRSTKSSSMSALLMGMGDEEEGESESSQEDNHVIDVELSRYKLLKSLPVQYEDETFSDPLAWWQMQEKLLPILSKIAKRLLCVPATSAPSERVFSVAGLTISKCRTSVQPQHASELIFLHDSWPLAEIVEKELEQNK